MGAQVGPGSRGPPRAREDVEVTGSGRRARPPLPPTPSRLLRVAALVRVVAHGGPLVSLLEVLSFWRKRKDTRGVRALAFSARVARSNPHSAGREAGVRDGRGRGPRASALVERSTPSSSYRRLLSTAAAAGPGRPRPPNIGRARGGERAAVRERRGAAAACKCVQRCSRACALFAAQEGPLTRRVATFATVGVPFYQQTFSKEISSFLPRPHASPATLV